MLRTNEQQAYEYNGSTGTGSGNKTWKPALGNDNNSNNLKQFPDNAKFFLVFKNGALMNASDDYTFTRANVANGYKASLVFAAPVGDDDRLIFIVTQARY